MRSFALRRSHFCCALGDPASVIASGLDQASAHHQRCRFGAILASRRLRSRPGSSKLRRQIGQGELLQDPSPDFTTIRPRTPHRNQKSIPSQFGQNCDIKKAGNTRTNDIDVDPEQLFGFFDAAGVVIDRMSPGDLRRISIFGERTSAVDRTPRLVVDSGEINSTALPSSSGDSLHIRSPVHVCRKPFPPPGRWYRSAGTPGQADHTRYCHLVRYSCRWSSRSL